jgi:uncharacterized membrane protein YjgN (DUF898 family)
VTATPGTVTDTAPPATTTGRFKYHGEGGELLGLILVNALLTILTLGIYSFWAKTKVREFHYSHTELDGDRFAYHGTGVELFKGGLLAGVVMFVFAMIFGVISTMFGRQPSPAVTIGITVGFYGFISLLVVYAVNAARKYRLSRSSWRGIRFSFHGDAGEFLGMMLKGSLLTLVTIGLYTPFFQNERRKFLVNNSRFGSEPFAYIGEGRPLFGPYLTALLLTIPTLGFSWIWYSAAKQRHFWNNTRMRGAKFTANIKGIDLLELQLLNMLLVSITLGIGTPWAITRTQAFLCERLTLEGTVDWATIQQRAQEAGATGEGLAEGFDVDVGIG